MHRRGLFIGLSLMAILATALLMAGSSRVFGFDAGNLGVAVLAALSLGALGLIPRLQRENIDCEVSPGEWRAWIAFAFTAVIAVYAVANAGVFNGPPLWQNADARRVGRTIAMLVFAWVVVSSIARQRWRGSVQDDERDREIERRAGNHARLALSLLALALVLLLGFTPGNRLTWAPPPMIAHLILLALIAASLVESGYTAIAYWRDRH